MCMIIVMVSYQRNENMNWECRDRRCDVSVERDPCMWFNIPHNKAADCGPEEIIRRYNEWIKRVHSFRDGLLPKE